MIERANDNNLCSVYDDAVDDLNRYLHVSLPTRNQDYTVTFRVTVDVNVSVTARDEDAARRSADNEFGVEAIVEELRNNGYEEARVYSVEQDD
jgi:hypothetical protein